MERITRVLHLLGFAAGAAVIAFGLARGLIDGATGPLLIALAVVVVGPVEDGLNRLTRHAPSEASQKAWITLIDRATSLIFLLLLAWSIALWP